MKSPTPETDELERVLRLVPDAAERHYGLALVRAFVLENHEEAVEQLRLAVEADPAHSQALCRLGDYYLKLGRHEEAVGAYRRAINVGGRGGLAAVDGVYMTLCVMGEKGRELVEGSSILQAVDPELARWILERKVSG